MLMFLCESGVRYGESRTENDRSPEGKRTHEMVSFLPPYHARATQNAEMPPAGAPVQANGEHLSYARGNSLRIW